jgi:hypothetical protein
MPSSSAAACRIGKDGMLIVAEGHALWMVLVVLVLAALRGRAGRPGPDQADRPAAAAPPPTGRRLR